MSETGGETALARIDTRDATPWTTYIVVFLAPAAIVYTIFSIYPLADTIRLSLYTADGSGIVRFAGLDNFVTLLTDARWAGPFWNAFGNNLIFFAIHMIVQN
jgi:raffinose/stachyose/melibiose transport system permease protein